MKIIDLKTYESKQKFYQSKAWRLLRKEKLTNDSLCEMHLQKDQIVPATEVHHIIDIDDIPTFENALNYNNLMSLCKSCHSSITGKKKKSEWKIFDLKDFLSNN
jgi:5-methylcytosine-specific restriction endonuclease McrA